jgi:hypothetical protein
MKKKLPPSPWLLKFEKAIRKEIKKPFNRRRVTIKC